VIVATYRRVVTIGNGCGTLFYAFVLFSYVILPKCSLLISYCLEFWIEFGWVLS